MEQQVGALRTGRSIGDRRSGLGDPAFAVGSGTAAVLIMVGSADVAERRPSLAGASLLILATAPLLVRRRGPVAVLVAVTVITYLYLWMGHPGGGELPLMMAALYTAFAEGHRRAGLSVLGTVAAVGIAYRVAVDGDPPVLIALTVSLLVLAALLGDGAHTRRRLRTEVQERLRTLELEKEAEARTHRIEERIGIARELHDVLAHTITTITVQTGAAADGMPPGSEGRDALRAVRATAQEAMEQLRTSIAVLRSDHDELPRSVVPGLDDVAELVRGVEDAGVAVTVQVEGTRRALPATVELTAYRILQEALTNVIRHADTRTATVDITYRPGTVGLVVTDGAGQAGPATVGASVDRTTPGDEAVGFGLTGMHERAHAVGGHLSAGPRPGGFQVRAVLPTRTTS